MPKENNKMQFDIDNLFKQNVNDLSAIKELYRKLKEVEEKITQIKYIDSNLANKLKKEYENLKKIILDENIQAKLTDDIETINSQLDNITNIVTHDISKIKGFDKNNIDIAISKLKNIVKDGDTIFLPNGNYIAKNTLDFNFGFMSRIKIILNGKITFNSNEDIPCISIGGQNLDVVVKHITNNNNNFSVSALNYETLNNTGISIDMLYHSKISIGIVEYFKNGIKIEPTNDQGVQYNNITFEYLRHNETGINFEVKTPLSWATESIYQGGRIRGKRGIKTNKIENQLDTYNNNRFLFIGMEDIVENGFELNWCTNTTIYHPRFERVGWYFIFEDSESSYNKYYTPYRGLNGNFKLNGKNSVLSGNIGVKDNTTKNAIYNITDKNANSLYYDCTLTPMPLENDSKVIIVKNRNGVKIEYGIKIVDIQTDKAPTSIYVDKAIYETDCYTFFINISKYTNTLNVLQPNNNDIAINSYMFDSVGLYMVINMGGQWLVCSKIGSQLAN